MPVHNTLEKSSRAGTEKEINSAAVIVSWKLGVNNRGKEYNRSDGSVIPDSECKTDLPEFPAHARDELNGVGIFEDSIRESKLARVKLDRDRHAFEKD